MRRFLLLAAAAALAACALFRWSGQPTPDKKPVGAQPAVHAPEAAPPTGKGLPLDKKPSQPLPLGATEQPRIPPATEPRP